MSDRENADDKIVPKFRQDIAILVIASSFSILAMMIIFSVVPVCDGTSCVPATENPTIPFDAILPLLGTWIGAVIAFYFGASNLDKAQKVITNLSQNKKQSILTINQLLKKYPESKNVTSCNVDDEWGTVKAKNSNHHNVLLKNKEGKIMGIFYENDVKDDSAMTDTDSWKANMAGSDIKDHITGKLWKDFPIINYATVSLEDSTSEAKEKFDKIANDNKDIKGLIILDETNVYAMIDYETLSKSINIDE